MPLALPRLQRRLILDLILALAVGVALRPVMALHPVWWLAWIAPAALLLLALRNEESRAGRLVGLAALVGSSVNFHYYAVVMPLGFALLATVGMALLWGLVVSVSRRAVLRWRAWWTVLVFPIVWVAVDTVMAAVLPDGNWASLAYTQSEVLPVLQTASLFGAAGVLFLVTLVPSTLAVGLHFGRSLRHAWRAWLLTTMLLAAALVYGGLRLQQPTTGKEMRIGLVAVDDAIGLRASDAYAAKILDTYDRRIAELAAQGADLIVTGEKLAMLTPAKAALWQQHFGATARANKLWLDASVGIDDGQRRVNLAWLFAPDGSLAATYQKQHLAPPERREQYSAGDQYIVQTIGGQRYGLVICKDMHFADLGRAYGQRQVSAMLVPAWDFDHLDEWMETRTTLMRGVENGYAVVRASRESLMTVSDAYGRIVAERPSTALPGAALLAKLNVAAPMSTLYTRIGNVLGWLCVALALAIAVLSRRKP